MPIRVNLLSSSGSQPQGNTKNDRIQRATSKAKKNKLEDHHRIVRPSLNKKKSVVDNKAISSITNSKLNVNTDLKCTKCNGCLFSDNHDSCVLAYINFVNASLKSKSVLKPVNRKIWQPTGMMFTTIRHIWRPTGQTFTLVENVCPLTRIATTAIVPLKEPTPIESNTDKPVVTLVYSRKSKAARKKVPVSNLKINKSVVVQIVLWYLDSGCSKHMTEDRSQLINFVQKFLGTVKLENDHVAKIIGYGEYKIGNVTILRVYFVEGLGHNLFSVGQFCDLDLEVGFRQHTYFIRNLDGVDLLTVASNNEAEYEALIAGPWIAAQMGEQNVHVLVEILKEKSIKEKEVTTVVEEDGPTWMTPIMEYLKEWTLPSDKKEAKKIRIKARQSELLEGVLYRRSFLSPWLRCVGPLQAKYVIREIHEGSCSMHAGPRSMVAKAIRLGYYWPTMHWDVRDMIPGPFPEGPGKVKFFIVTMDYSNKWIEAKAVATITGSQVKKFVWDNIVCRFGLLGEIVSKNDKQFSDNPFKDWCDKLNITQRFASVKHPQFNGLVERANQSLGEGIKARLDEGNKNWVEKLPHVLWAHRIMIKSSHDDTPFSLTYETEAVIPAEIRMPTYRTAVVDVVYNDEELRLNLDLLEERRKRAAIYEAKAKLKMTKYYNARVRGITFRPGDFIYYSNDDSHAVA
nr:protein NYNRIN-like [Tanacetum cinerariifolium]